MELLLSVPGWGGTHLESPTKKNCDHSLGSPKGTPLGSPKGIPFRSLKTRTFQASKKGLLQTTVIVWNCYFLFLAGRDPSGESPRGFLGSPTGPLCAPPRVLPWALPRVLPWALPRVLPGLLPECSLGLSQGYSLGPPKGLSKRYPLGPL